jgi:hypothetical protein
LDLKIQSRCTSGSWESEEYRISNKEYRISKLFWLGDITSVRIGEDLRV